MSVEEGYCGGLKLRMRSRKFIANNFNWVAPRRHWSRQCHLRGGLMQPWTTPRPRSPSFSLGAAQLLLLALSLIAGFCACIRTRLVHSLSSLLNTRRDRLTTTREKTPLQGSRFADSSTVHPPSPVLTRRQQPLRVICAVRSAAMANLFRRIYDWLLRLFWYAHLPLYSTSHAHAWMPDALFDTATSSISVQAKSKVVCNRDRR